MANKPCRCTEKKPVSKRPTKDETIDELFSQRHEFETLFKEGNQFAQMSIDFIDNMLAQLIPDYVPPKGRSCRCDH